MKALEWQGDYLLLLDQTKLPFEEKYREARSYLEVAEAIKNMEVRGAPAIGAAAAYGYALGALKFEGEKDVFFEYMNEVLTTLQSTRPTAVNLTWALHRMEVKLREVQNLGLPEIKEALLAEAESIAEADRRMNRLIGEYGNTIVPEKVNILTHLMPVRWPQWNTGQPWGLLGRHLSPGKKFTFMWMKPDPSFREQGLPSGNCCRKKFPIP